MDSDLTARARLRDATIALIAEGETPSARSVAARAEVSIGLIRHHFGTMNGLLLASDERIAALVKDAKRQHIDGPLPNIFASLQATGEDRVLGYLAHRLTQPSAAIDALVDQLVADAVGYWQEAFDAGLARPVADLPVAARMLTLYSPLSPLFTLLKCIGDHVVTPAQSSGATRFKSASLGICTAKCSSTTRLSE